jgi:AraC-like DNA-binding protein
VKKEQSAAYYNAKIQTFANAMDQQIYSAQRIVSDLNTSSLINKLYVNVQMDKPIDSYLLYQVLNDIRLQKTASDNLNIYDIALILNQYDKIYTSNEVIRLPERIDFSKLEIKPIVVQDLNSVFGMNNDQLIFYKKYFIYSSKYKYGPGSTRGMICVLFEDKKITELLESVCGDGSGLVMYYGGTPVLTKGSLEGNIFHQQSRANENISYEISASPDMFTFRLGDLSFFALLFGFLIFLFYVFLAYFFAYRYASPFERIRQLMGKGKREEKNEGERIVEDVENLLGERNDYMEQVHTISPYASQGILYSLISGDYDSEGLSQGILKNFVEFKKMFFLAAVIDIWDSSGNKNHVKEVKNRIKKLAAKETESDYKILCYEKDVRHLFLILNSDKGELLEDRLYEVFERINQDLPETVVLTMGADDVREEFEELNASCDRAIMTLDRILWEDRGSVYFYDVDLEFSLNYYFPKNPVKSLIKAVKEKDREWIENFFEEIREKNEQDCDQSVTANQLLLSELYVTVGKVLQISGEFYGIPFRKVEKCPDYMTIEEVISYYKKIIYQMLLEAEDKMESEEELPGLDAELIGYINRNERNPDLSLAQIADHFSVSCKYVTSLVKKRFGVTYLKYVQERRVEYAVHLLKTTDLSLERIAEECGYTNMLTFRRNFKAIMEKNPSDCRMGKEGMEE